MYQGRWSLVNNLMVENTGLADLCTIANQASEMKAAIAKMIDLPFDEAQLNHRKEVLKTAFCNQTNVKILVGLM